MEGGDVAMLGSEGVERGLLLLDFGLQNIGRVGLTDVGELARGLGGVGGEGAELLASIDLLLKSERGVEGAFEIGFDALLLRGEGELTGALLCLIDIAATPQFAAERDGLLKEGALLAATVGAAADLIAFVADDEVGPEASLLGAAGAFGNGGLRGTASVGLWVRADARSSSRVSAGRVARRRGGRVRRCLGLLDWTLTASACRAWCSPWNAGRALRMWRAGRQ